MSRVTEKVFQGGLVGHQVLLIIVFSEIDFVEVSNQVLMSGELGELVGCVFIVEAVWLLGALHTLVSAQRGITCLLSQTPLQSFY